MIKIKKYTLLSIAIFGLHLCSLANPVDYETAKVVASKFMGTNDLQLFTTYTTDKSAAALYIFNTTNGFVIVSADDCETPIIGYSHEGRFDPNEVPVQMEEYLQDFVARIQYGIENNIEADETTAKQWKLVKTIGRLNDRKAAKSVEPLLTEKWHQGCLYNNLCPEMSGPCDHAEVGCVAVAMGQIMHYWGYPTTGWGSHSYYNQGVELSADFGNTTFDWQHMPDSLTETSSDTEIEAVATLLYHCGVSVNMEYGANGSNASSANVPDVLKRYFDFSRQLHRDKKGSDNAEWMAKLKACLDLQRPIYYSGQGNAGGHAFVCDGYDADDLLHFNWGWGGNGDGYFALGDLNPIGYNFNSNNYAILDIFPQYEPCMVTATVYPPSAGTVEGNGEYHLGEQCTLTAVQVESSRFDYWKKDGRIVSQENPLRLNVENDFNDIEAYFSFKPVKEITVSHAPDTNDMNSPYVSLSWNFDDNDEWDLLKQFEINDEKLVATDGEHIYTAYLSNSEYTGTFGKYTMDGELVEFFNIDGAKPDGLTGNGSYFYCSKNFSGYLYRYDFNNKTLIDSTYMNNQFSRCAYDANYDGFWLKIYPNSAIFFVNRQGESISASIPTYYYPDYYPDGFGGITVEDGNRHLMVLCNNRCVYDFDIYNEYLNIHPITCLDFPGYSINASIGKYDGKDALFVILNYYGIGNNHIHIYEINSHLAPILHYRIYRADSEGHTVILADEVTGTSYLDLTWNNTNAGEYRFGISEVYFNGVESEIIWSRPILSPFDGINENNSEQEDTEQSIQKVVEGGKIIIIKNGKRYSVSGQHLN